MTGELIALQQRQSLVFICFLLLAILAIGSVIVLNQLRSDLTSWLDSEQRSNEHKEPIYVITNEREEETAKAGWKEWFKRGW